MSDIQLSKDAKYLLCIIYKYYLELHDTGIPKSKAKDFNSIDIIHGLIPEFSLDDIHETCLELTNKGLLIKKKPYITEKYCRFMLSDEGISYMENRNLTTAKSVIDFLLKLKP